MLQAVVIAGGEGQRMKSVLGNTPKILSPIGKDTLLDVYIKLFKANNIQKIHFCLGVGGHEILKKLKITVSWALDSTKIHDRWCETRSKIGSSKQ